MSDLPNLDADAVARLLSLPDAINVITAALRGGLDPASGTPRSTVATTAGHLLMMPAEHGGRVGVKIASVAPGNSSRGLPRIHAQYLLFDASTLAPLAVLDGTALTALRTPATSAVAIDLLATPGPADVVLFGLGPQARGHLDALAAVRPLGRVRVIGREDDQAAAFCAEVRESTGVQAVPGRVEDVAEATVVICATSAAWPLFDGALIRDEACVVAIGSHEPSRRELGARLMGRSMVVVEDRATALREAGDVVLAVEEATLLPSSLVGLAQLVRGEVKVDWTRPRVFKGVGMAWQDLVVAAEVLRRHLAG